MSANVVFITSSPSAHSRSSFVAEFVASAIKERGYDTRVFSPHDFNAEDLVFGRTGGAAVAAFVLATRAGAGLVVATPVYKAAYSGALKAIVDLIPPDALVGKPALAIATTRLPAHAAPVEAAFRALLAFFQANALDPLVLFDEGFHVDAQAISFGPAARGRAAVASEKLALALSAVPQKAAATEGRSS